jgi:hypothetical protein
MADDDLEEFFSDEIEHKDEQNRLANDYSAWLTSVIGPHGVGHIVLSTDHREMRPHWAQGMDGATYYRSLLRKNDLELLRKLHRTFVGLSQQLRAKQIHNATDGIIRGIGGEQRAIVLCQEAMKKVIKANNLHADWARPDNVSILLYEGQKK